VTASGDASGAAFGRADAVDAGLRRVLGLSSATPVRADTPLPLLGVDSLALVCLGDALAEKGWHLDEVRARDAQIVGDLTDACEALP